LIRRSAQEFFSREAEGLALVSEAYRRSEFPQLQRKLGELLSTAAGRPSLLFRMIQAEVVATAVCFVPAFAQAIPPAANMKDGPNSLLYVSLCLLMMVYWWSLFALESTREALKPGGALDQLKAGVKLVNRSSFDKTRALKRAGMGFSAFVVVVCFVILLAATLDTKSPWQLRGSLILCAVAGLLVIPTLFCGWWPSMYTGSMLCRESITAVIKSAKTVDPIADGGETWRIQVAEPALALRAKIDLLSKGWSLGLVGLGGCFGFAGAGWFTLAMNSAYCRGLAEHIGVPWNAHYFFCLTTAAICPFLALLLAFDLASTSDCVLDLMEQLNLSALEQGPQGHRQFDWLETRLARLVRHTHTLDASPSQPCPV
jgi:hypothetical protein